MSQTAQTTLRSATVGDVVIRDAGAGDFEPIVDVCSAALGWDDPLWDRALFAWKHTNNAFGESVVLVAEDDTGILGVRTLMMWRFASHLGTVRAARAVDTATRPDAQGRGLFRALTEAGIESLQRRGVAFIFNTPNAASRPGYLRMGWHEEGRIEFGFRVRSALAVPRVLRSKVAAAKPSISTPHLGQDPLTFIDELPPPESWSGHHWRTDHTLDTLRWRYTLGPVEYRALPMGDAAGAIVRVRRRGHARELLVAERIGTVDPDLELSVYRDAMRLTKCTHLIAEARTPGTFTTSRVGPDLTMREVTSFTPSADDISWAPGDLELF